MTARVCPVHGEYAADGICRWCEPGAKPSGADQSTIALPLGCICQKCLRGFDAPIPLTSLLCPECRNPPTYMGAPVVLDAGASSFADAPPMLVNWGPTEKSADAYVTRLEWTEARLAASRLGYDVLMLKHWHSELAIAEEANLLAQHAALRWERVARRWEAKRPFRCACSETALDYLGDARMFRQDETKWKRHTTKRCDGDLVNPMCQCGEWLFDAVLFRGFGEPFAKYAAGLLHTPERCAPPQEFNP